MKYYIAHIKNASSITTYLHSQAIIETGVSMAPKNGAPRWSMVANASGQQIIVGECQITYYNDVDWIYHTVDAKITSVVDNEITVMGDGIL